MTTAEIVDPRPKWTVDEQQARGVSEYSIKVTIESDDAYVEVTYDGERLLMLGVDEALTFATGLTEAASVTLRALEALTEARP